MTAKNVQAIARKNGEPWSTCKGLDTFTPIGKYLTRSSIPSPNNVLLSFKLNGEVKQYGSTEGLIYSIPQLISYVSGIFRLEEGDVVLTGTPDGVGFVEIGDEIVAEIKTSEGEILDRLEMSVGQREKGFAFDRHWLESL